MEGCYFGVGLFYKDQGLNLKNAWVTWGPLCKKVVKQNAHIFKIMAGWDLVTSLKTHMLALKEQQMANIRNVTGYVFNALWHEICDINHIFK